MKSAKSSRNMKNIRNIAEMRARGYKYKAEMSKFRPEINRMILMGYGSFRIHNELKRMQEQGIHAREKLLSRTAIENYARRFRNINTLAIAVRHSPVMQQALNEIFEILSPMKKLIDIYWEERKEKKINKGNLVHKY